MSQVPCLHRHLVNATRERSIIYMGSETEKNELWKEMLNDFVKEGDVSLEVIQKYQRKISKEIVYLWKNYGYGTFYNGFFKVINPEEFEDIFHKLVDYGNPIVPVLVTGMGDTFAFECRQEEYFTIYRPRYDEVDFINGGLPHMAENIYNERLRELCFRIKAYEEAVEKYGVPSYENCFSYTIPLVRGGYDDIEHLVSVPVKKFLDEMYQLLGQYDWSSKQYAPISKKDKNFKYEIHPNTINITKNAIFIQEKEFPAPLDIDKIREYVKEKDIKGIDTEKRDGVLFISFGLSDRENYGGTLLVEGEPWVYAKRKPATEDHQKQMLDQYSIEYWLRSKTILDWVEITAFDEKRYKAMVEKYKIPKLTEEVLEFKDFNFKLMIIQNLMYEQKILKPEFNLEEFAEQCKNDIDLQSMEPIKEVERYFKKLPIPKSMAESVTELNADGGDEIYAQISPGWDGEEDWYEVKKSIDVSQFPNLKKIDDEFFTKKAQKELKTYLEQL